MHFRYLKSSLLADKFTGVDVSKNLLAKRPVGEPPRAINLLPQCVYPKEPNRKIPILWRGGQRPGWLSAKKTYEPKHQSASRRGRLFYCKRKSYERKDQCFRYFNRTKANAAKLLIPRGGSPQKLTTKKTSPTRVLNLRRAGLCKSYWRKHQPFRKNPVNLSIL